MRHLFLSVAFLAAVQPALASKAPEIDVFASAAAGRHALTREVLDFARPGTPVHVEARLGVPTFLQPARTGENGRRALARKAVEAESVARAHLLDLAPAWGLAPEDVLEATLRQVHDTGSGPIVVQLRQQAFGVPVFRDEIRIAMDRSFEPIAVSGYLPSVVGLPEPLFALDARAAIARAAAGLGAGDVEPATLRALGSAPGGYDLFASADGLRVASPVRVRKVLFHLPGDLVPSWYLELDVAGEGASSDLYACVVSARDGSLLYRHSLTEADAYLYRVWAETSGLKMPLNGPQGRAGDPYPGTTPDRWQAPFVAPALVSLSSGPISTRDPWLPDGATETNGNNVDAYADLKTPDGFSDGDLRADVSSPGAFDRTFDVTKAPDASADQRKAAITQLFYTTNFLHDWFYDAGFDEVAGNAQASNFGRGGIERDALRAEAQDYSGTDNANMSTPADGGPPRMQMYTFAMGAPRSVRIIEPATPARTFAAGFAMFGPGAFSVSGPVTLTNDGSSTPTAACVPIVNAGAVRGSIALVDAGSCAYNLKVANAQAAGAIGVVIANDVDDTLYVMGETIGATPLPFSIPVLYIGKRDGAMLRSLIPDLTVALDRAPNRDGAIDNQVVSHEWCHYLSNRLIGDANGLSANQSRSLGEGWGDFCALLLTVQAGDASLPGNDGYRGIYASGGYASGGQSPSGSASPSWYFGVRRYPYSTDTSIDPLTYAHIRNGVRLPPGPPLNVEFFGDSVRDGTNNAEVHNAGEVWGTMLWECYAALLRDTARLSFDVARDRMRNYLVASMKLTPVNPTLLEARDALLAVAFGTDREDHALFARAFAKRGAGPRAVDTSDRFTTTNAGVVESFDVGGDLSFVSAVLDDADAPCDRDGILDAGETGRLTLTFRNRGLGRLAATQLSVASDNPAVSFPSGTTFGVPITDPTQATSLSVPVKLAAGTAGIQSLAFGFTLRDPGLLSDVAASATLLGNRDEVPWSSASDDVEASRSFWTPGSDPKLDGSASFKRLEVTLSDHRWSSQALTKTFDVWLVSPPLVAGPAGFSFTIRHRYTFYVSSGVLRSEGGVIEISEDDGKTWSDVGTEAISGGYDNPISIVSGHALAKRPAFTGNSRGFPGFLSVTVTPNASFAGKKVLVRFRRGGFAVPATWFWEIDDIAFSGILNKPFSSVVADRGRCRNRVNPAGSGAGVTVVKKN